LCVVKEYMNCNELEMGQYINILLNCDTLRQWYSINTIQFTLIYIRHRDISMYLVSIDSILHTYGNILIHVNHVSSHLYNEPVAFIEILKYCFIQRPSSLIYTYFILFSFNFPLHLLAVLGKLTPGVRQ